MRFLIIFIFFTFNALASEVPNNKNLLVNKELKAYDNISFFDSEKKLIKLSSFRGNLVIINFWATWCAPCKREMPSLDTLLENSNLDNLKIFPINIGKENLEKSKKFFKDLNIKNLDIYFDNDITLAKDLSLRGVPTTILFNKEGKEFARIAGYIDFNDEEFIRWLSKYN
ncbi:TlpA family protein disulfide reductase [Candidatus Pelagibacter sp.]|nr:TlpA family protein disulfide reductase [Candidatus Pelagibacter sp.]